MIIQGFTILGGATKIRGNRSEKKKKAGKVKTLCLERKTQKENLRRAQHPTSVGKKSGAIV